MEGLVIVVGTIQDSGVVGSEQRHAIQRMGLALGEVSGVRQCSTLSFQHKRVVGAQSSMVRSSMSSVNLSLLDRPIHAHNEVFLLCTVTTKHRRPVNGSFDSDISQPAIATSSLIPRPLPLCVYPLVCVHNITQKGNSIGK